MKILLLCLSLVAISASRVFATQFGLTEIQKNKSPNEWGEIVYHTQLSIVLDSDENEFKTNQPIKLLVRIRNLSTNDEYGVIVQTPISSTDGLTFTIMSPTGKNLSPAFHRITRVSGLAIDVHPGQTDGFRFDLGDMCKADELGTYKIIFKMRRWTPDRKKSYEITSNPLNVVVAQ